jgi:hypothetical protein
MAFFGAPVRRQDDVWQSVQASFDMLETLERFNTRQRAKGQPPFRIGIGITYGPVTLGNIGSQKKMDYTVIGRRVNLASRLEKLTKYYQKPLVITDEVRRAVSDKVTPRLLDRTMVKGMTRGIEVWTTQRTLSEAEREAWPLHEKGMRLYFARDYGKAMSFFSEVRKLLPDDEPSRIFIERCQGYLKVPPPAGWDGVFIQPEGSA